MVSNQQLWVYKISFFIKILKLNDKLGALEDIKEAAKLNKNLEYKIKYFLWN